MSKIAFLVGVSSYINSEPLSSCKNDAILLHDILSASNEFDDIFLLSGDITQSAFFDSLTSLVNKYRLDPPDQLLFYFSGHGYFDGKYFYYLPSDFHNSSINSTTIRNEDLDQMFKAISPKVMIKIVDACHSGISYVKDPHDLEQYVKGVEEHFNDCYFLFSSRKEEFSFAGYGLSAFTLSLAKAIQTKGIGNIFYFDIISQLRDDNELNKIQEPYFVTQGSLSDSMLTVNEKILSIINYSLNSIIQENPEPAKTLIDIIMDDSKRYCKKEDLSRVFNELKTSFYGMVFNDTIDKLYNIDMQCMNDHDNVPGLDYIGTWLEVEGKNYFAKPRWGTRQIDIQDDNFEHQMSAIITGKPKPFKMKTIRIISDYIVTEDYPFEQIRIDLQGKEPNVPWFTCIILFVFSQTDIQFFFEFFPYHNSGFEKWVINTNNLRWRTLNCGIMEINKEGAPVKRIRDEFIEYIISYLNKIFEVPGTNMDEAGEKDI